jgi:hypothetical protein
MAGGTHFHLEVMAQRRPGLEGVPATADDVDLFVFGMTSFFHK